MNNYIKESQSFLLELIHLYSAISVALHGANIPTDPQQLLTLTQSLSSRNCIDRGIRRQNELRLFRQTLALAQQMSAKLTSVRKSDLVIKVSVVSKVLEQRLQEQLIAPSSIKAKVLDHIRSEKEIIQRWAANITSHSRSKPSPPSKETGNYVLKYVFTDQTQTKSQHPSTEGPSNQQNTSSLRNVKERDLSILEKKKRRPQTAVHQGSTNSLKRFRKNERQNEILKKDSSFFSSSKSPAVLDESKENLLQINPISQLDDTINGVNQGQGQGEQELETFSLFKKSNKCITVERNLEEEEEQEQERRKREERLSQKYYISQRYLLSKKNIEAAANLIPKLKKRSINTFTKTKDSFQELNQQHLSSQSSSQLSPRSQMSKFFYSKHIATDFCPGKIKSQKTISNDPVVIEKPSKIPLRRSERKNSAVSRRSSERSRTSMVAIKNNIQLLKPSHFCKMNFKVDHEEIPEERPEDTPAPQHSLGDFYSQLKCMREHIVEKSEDWIKDFSVFFWQQHLLEEKENRKIQKKLAERKNCPLMSEFEMKMEIGCKKGGVREGLNGSWPERIEECWVVGQVDLNHE